MHGVIRVDKLLQRGLGLLRRDAILLCIPAEGHQLVACKRVGQLRRSHRREWQRPLPGGERERGRRGRKRRDGQKPRLEPNSTAYHYTVHRRRSSSLYYTRACASRLVADDDDGGDVLGLREELHGVLGRGGHHAVDREDDVARLHRRARRRALWVDLVHEGAHAARGELQGEADGLVARLGRYGEIWWRCREI